MNLTLFLGAGVSRPSGLPIADEITQRVLHGHGDTMLYGPVIDGEIRDFLSMLSQREEDFLEWVGGDSSPDYESIFYLCDQVRRTLRGENRNAAVAPFVRSLEESVNLGERNEESLRSRNELHLLNPFLEEHEYRLLAPLEWISTQGTELIKQTVWDALRKGVEEVKGFDLLRHLAKSPDVDRLFVVTLNHDTLIERVLEEDGVKYVDGFGTEDGTVRWFNPRTFDSVGPSTGQDARTGPEVYVVKPHGSIDWYYFGSQRGEMIGKSHPDPTWGHVDGEGRELTCLRKHPVFLTGGQKELEYHGHVYSTMQEVFLRALNSSSTVVSSGYSWNDLGLSRRLISWGEVVEGNRILLLHEDWEVIRSSSTGINAKRFDDLVGRGIIRVVDRWFQDVTWSEVQDHLD